MRNFALAAVPWIILLGCHGSTPPETPAAELGAILAMGDSIAKQTQQVLMGNVAAAMQRGGPAYAVDFCNTQAVPLTDSMAARFAVTVQRLSDRNRNPGNAIAAEADRAAWKRISEGQQPFVAQRADGGAWYYKPIFIGMPTCLKCHGGAGDIAPETLAVLAERYPADKAVGYRDGELRGLWKIGFQPTRRGKRY